MTRIVTISSADTSAGVKQDSVATASIVIQLPVGQATMGLEGLIARYCLTMRMMMVMDISHVIQDLKKMGVNVLIMTNVPVRPVIKTLTVQITMAVFHVCVT